MSRVAVQSGMISCVPARRWARWGVSLLLLSVVTCSDLAFAQVIVRSSVAVAGGDDASKRTNGFSVRKEENAVSEALQEFERYCGKEAWEKAFASLSKITEAAPSGLTPAADGFYVPSRARLRQLLTSLPPAGKQAYRLFNDAKAKQLFAQLEMRAEADEADRRDGLSKLQDLFDQFFVTSIGDQIADRLGDAKFECGDFTGAAECWNSILTEFPETSLSPVRLSTKRAIALCRAGRGEELAAALAQIREKYASQPVRIGGRDVVATVLLGEMEKEMTSSSSAATAPAEPTAAATVKPFRLPEQDDPLWQSQFADERFFKQVNDTINGMGWGGYIASPAQSVPSSATDGQRVYMNWFGVGMAIDIETGKLLWRTGSFEGLPQKMRQSLQQGMAVDDDSAIAVASGAGSQASRVLLVRGSGMGRGQSTASLSCLSAEDGKPVWSTAAGALSGWNFTGAPLVSGDTIYAAARPSSSMDLSLLAIALSDGKLLWKLPLGTLTAGRNFRGMSTAPDPVLRQSASSLYVMTSNGAVLAVNLRARRVDWAFAYDTLPAANQEMYYYPRAREAPQFPAGCELSGSTLYIKDKALGALYALDVAGPSLKWRRPVDANATVAAADASALYLLGEEVDLIDLANRDMRWSTKTPVDSGDARPLVAGSHLYLYGSRGVYDIDLRSGERKIFRGYDHDGIGGAVWRVGDRMICVSNRAVTAYRVSNIEP